MLLAVWCLTVFFLIMPLGQPAASFHPQNVEDSNGRTYWRAGTGKDGQTDGFSMSMAWFALLCHESGSTLGKRILMNEYSLIYLSCYLCHTYCTDNLCLLMFSLFTMCDAKLIVSSALWFEVNCWEERSHRKEDICVWSRFWKPGLLKW
jgi:hypothetical protein